MTSTTTDLSTVPTKILKTDSKGRIRFPAEMREELLDRFEQSGMSGAEFARHFDITYPTFAYWRQKRERDRRNAEGKDEGCEFVEVRLPESQEKKGLRVDLPGGASTMITTAGEARLAADLIKGLQEC
jgi:transposase-like protein